MAAICTAWSAKEQGHEGKENGTAAVYNRPSNRSVILNRASEHYLALIFKEYSDNFTGRISIIRFNDLIHDLRVGDGVMLRHQPHEDTDEDKHKHKHKDHKHKHKFHTRSTKLLQEEFTSGKQRRSKRQNKGNNEAHSQSSGLQGLPQRPRETGERVKRDIDEYSREKCLEEHTLMSIHKVNEKVGLSQADFVRICPSLIHQLRAGFCDQEKESNKNVLESTDLDMLCVWGYGVLSITVISLASLLAIAIIPFIGRSFYKKLMSFLVALAVGTLAGDALLHLIPHAFHDDGDSEEHGREGHRTNVFKSCVIMAGIYVFFLVECVLKARLSRKRQTPGKSHACKDVTPPEEMSLTQKKEYIEEYEEMIGSRLAGNQLHASCYIEVESGKEERACNSSESPQGKGSLWELGLHCHQQGCISEKGKHSLSDAELVAVLHSIQPSVYSGKNLGTSTGESENPTDRNFEDIRCFQANKNGSPVLSETITTTTDTTSGFEAEHHGDYHNDHQHDHDHHHHHHSHNIDKHTSIASVAWMVIIGDGFHNFSDGLAVGAAFAVSMTSGLTTAIAVFCHELPHELGDFAILLKSGLTFRQAVTYNVASAIISYIGLVLGIIIGDIHSAHSWVLALTAGMFLYVSLVDMLPELGKYIQEGGDWSVVLSQNLGMLTGTSIMLVIALYEHYAN